jgi:hypothetical protein
MGGRVVPQKIPPRRPNAHTTAAGETPEGTGWRQAWQASRARSEAKSADVQPVVTRCAAGYRRCLAIDASLRIQCPIIVKEWLMSGTKFFASWLGAWVGTLAAVRAADDHPGPSARIVEYGRYAVTVETIQAAHSATETTVNLKDRRHVATTRLIPCRVGEAWGFRVRWQNLPRDREYKVRIETLHPQFQHPDGTVSEKYETEFTMAPGTVPDPLMVNWCFLKEFEYELVPGEWTDSVYIDGKKVASMTFRIQEVKP